MPSISKCNSNQIQGYIRKIKQIALRPTKPDMDMVGNSQNTLGFILTQASHPQNKILNPRANSLTPTLI